jgi:hypothetical protein
VADGWLTVRVTDGPKPRSGVSVTCLVGATVWASGETDADGRGSFPTPTAEWCQFVFDLGVGPSAPVPLTLLKDGTVVPVSSPVLDGTADCCVVPDFRGRRAESASLLTDGEWQAVRGVVVLGIGLVAGVGYVVVIRPRTPQSKSQSKPKRKK